MPVFLNPAAGGAARVRDALTGDTRIVLRELKPARIADAVRVEIERGTPRIAVCGGDGTLSTALGAARNELEVGIIPGGTLNHFARDCRIPVDDPHAALDIALHDTAQPVDLGFVNGRPVLNTSSVGVYVDFVRRRELLELRLRYRIASVGAAFSVWHDPRAFDVELQTADGVYRRVRTPLLFVGVQERVLERGAPGTLGIRRPGGARALQVIVVNEHTPLKIRSLLFRAILRGIDGLIEDDEIGSYLTTRIAVASAQKRSTIAIDGELVDVTWPLEYALVRDAVKVVRPMIESALEPEFMHSSHVAASV
jgi:diacylglycerol kinase family enzyme